MASDLDGYGIIDEWRLNYKEVKGGRMHSSPDGPDVWRTVKILGKGSFGTVCLEECTSGPQHKTLRAVKAIANHYLTGQAKQRELYALISFSDKQNQEYRKYFVQCSGWFNDDNFIYIAMEFIQHGSLQDYVDTKQPIPEVDAALITGQVAHALQYMHQNNFVHRDLKPLNILVQSRTPEWHVKVADFGLAKNTEGTFLATQNMGSHGYIAPEVLKSSRRPYTAAVDIWALGAIAYCMQTGKPPFPDLSKLFNYVQGIKEFPLQNIARSSSWYCVEFVQKTMQAKAQNRLTIEQCIAHEWLSASRVAGDDSDSDVSVMDDTVFDIDRSDTWATQHDNVSTIPLTNLPLMNQKQTPNDESPSTPQYASNTVVGASVQQRANTVIDSPRVAALSSRRKSEETEQATVLDEDNDVTSAQSVDLESKNEDGHSPLALAAINGQASAILELLDRGAKIEFKDEDGNTPLALAAKNGHKAAIRKLLNRGAKIESKNQDGQSALAHAAMYGHEAAVRFLLDRGANIESRDLFGHSPLALASQWGHDAVVRLLIDRGAKVEPKKQDGYPPLALTADQMNLRVTLVAADRLIKRNPYECSSPYAVIFLDGQQKKVSAVCKRTQNPRWNESFDFRATESSILEIEIWDRERHSEKAKKFLGAIIIRVGDGIELAGAPRYKLHNLILQPRDDLVVHGGLAISFSTHRTRLPTR